MFGNCLCHINIKVKNLLFEREEGMESYPGDVEGIVGCAKHFY